APEAVVATAGVEAARGAGRAVPAWPPVAGHAHDHRAGSVPSVTAFERLEQRAVRPIGLVSGDLAWSQRPGHPAARGLAAAQPGLAAPSLEPVQAGEAPQAHPSRGVLAALARAGSPEQVVQTVMERAADPAAIRSLPAPLAEVVQQIRRQVQQAAAKLPASAGGHIAHASLARRRPQSRAPSAAERLPALASDGAGTDVVSLATQRLIRRLQQLVHIAEVDRRELEAQRRVRRAEDSAQARAEASSSSAPASAAGSAPVDLDTLGRDVLAVVNHQFQARNERRQEDPDVRNDVWW
ncbi:MAG: hypothetical protein ABIO70_08580, partial [Pseudomonadota bacterium]